ncbi:wall-associated receptor kinase 2 [Abeliophyllum distichum]|uniref:Wall-associated receptor kinase 2 n=1 Tax=Abeliophyllum distichum TaxID=126358 RepID=A0ABD1RDW3_9LAMI
MLVHSALLQIFIFFTVLVVVVAPPPSIASESPKPIYQIRCGNLEIPYPFGIGSNCSLNLHPYFNISCNTSFNPPKPYLLDNGPSEIYNYEVVNISETQIYVKNSKAQLTMACYVKRYDNKTRRSPVVMEFSYSPYTLSDANKVTSIGCVDMVMVQQD